MGTRFLAFPPKFPPILTSPSPFPHKPPSRSSPKLNFLTLATYPDAVLASKSNFDEQIIKLQEKEDLSWESYNKLIQTHCKNGLADKSLTLLCQMESLGMHPNKASNAFLTDALGSLGRTLEADAMFREMKWLGLRPSLRYYNVLLRGFLRKGQLKLADRLLVEMGEDGIDRSRETYMLLLNSYAHSGRLEDTWWVIGEMK